jgi:hypothetical protein
MKIEIRERDRRALIGLSLAVGLYLLATMVAFPAYDSLVSAADEASAKEEQLRKYRRALVRKGHYTQLLDQARKNMTDAEARLIRGDNASLASVELQNIVEEAAKKVGIPLGQRNMSTARKKDAFFNEITMTLSFESTPNQLTMFLSEIRTSPKFITVRNAQVAPVQVLQEAPKKGEFLKTIRANLTLAAILAAPAAPPAPAPAGTPAATVQEKKG